MATERWQRVSRSWPLLREFKGRQFHAAYVVLHVAGAVVAAVALLMSVGGALAHMIAVVDGSE